MTIVNNSIRDSNPPERNPAFDLLIYNPSSYPRDGHITVAWDEIYKATGYEPDELLLLQEGEPLFYQVDRIDPGNPSRDTLSFFLAKPILPGTEDYSSPTGRVSIYSDNNRQKRRGQKRPLEQKAAVELSNSELVVRLNLSPELEGSRGDWYAGSVTSVRLNELEGMEFLDYLTAMFSAFRHDPEKRCMQIDSIQLLHSQQSEPFMSVNLFCNTYRLISESTGPVRQCVTIASTPFYVYRWDSDTQELIQVKCELYRIFSLYAGRDYIVEELFVKASAPESNSEEAGISLYFRAHYFSYIVQDDMFVSRYEHVPNWFVISNSLYNAYGFAADVTLSRVLCPHPDYPYSERRFNTFSWELDPCKSARCLHLFKRYKPVFDNLELGWLDLVQKIRNEARESLEHQTGHAWYESIYKPLTARLAVREVDMSTNYAEVGGIARQAEIAMTKAATVLAEAQDNAASAAWISKVLTDAGKVIGEVSLTLGNAKIALEKVAEDLRYGVASQAAKNALEDIQSVESLARQAIVELETVAALDSSKLNSRRGVEDKDSIKNAAAQLRRFGILKVTSAVEGSIEVLQLARSSASSPKNSDIKSTVTAIEEAVGLLEVAWDAAREVDDTILKNEVVRRPTNKVWAKAADEINHLARTAEQNAKLALEFANREQTVRNFDIAARAEEYWTKTRECQQETINQYRSAMAVEVMLNIVSFFNEHQEQIFRRLEECESRAARASSNGDRKFMSESLPIINGIIHVGSTRDELKLAIEWVRKNWGGEDFQLRIVLSALLFKYVVRRGLEESARFADEHRHKVWERIQERVKR